jgi:cysteinyl-tRNA synthetase
MITINGKKMGKSYNNVIKLTELFSGNHPILEQAYHPMVVRFYILQTHYRSTLDFSNEALQASEKALKRLWEAYENLKQLIANDNLFEIIQKESKNDDIVKNFDGISINEIKPLIEKELTKFEAYFSSNSNFSSFELVNSFFENEISDTVYLYSKTNKNEINSDYAHSNKYALIETIFLEAAVSPILNQRISLTNSIKNLCSELDDFMNDDLNTAKVIANLFELAPIINSIKGGQISSDALSTETLQLLKDTFKTYLEDILGLQGLQAQQSDTLDKVLSLLIEIRKDARTRKDWATSDQIRIKLAEAGVLLKDGKDGSVTYTIE